MKIDIRKLPEGEAVLLEESKKPEELDLELTGIKPASMIRVKAEAIKFSNTLDVRINMTARASAQCWRCLSDLEINIDKNFRLDYPITPQDTIIDLSDDLRQEIILDYPLKPLCNPDCPGLCVKCGKNLNEGPCDCG